MRFQSGLAAAALFLFPATAMAQSPGSVESELKYAREYLEAGKWDYAMWRYEAILARDPGNAEAQAGYERAKAGRTGGGANPAAPVQPKPKPRPQPQPPANPGLKVGDVVEFDRFSDGSWGRIGQIKGINGNPASPCPSYHVEEPGGVTLSYVCGRVRPATPAQIARLGKDTKPSKPAAGPPTGSYFCTYGVNRGQVLGPGRNFTIMANGAYAADDGERGTYSYDSGSGRITFRGGFFGRMQAWGEFIGGRSNQIDINPKNGLLTYCSKQ